MKSVATSLAVELSRLFAARTLVVCPAFLLRTVPLCRCVTALDVSALGAVSRFPFDPPSVAVTGRPEDWVSAERAGVGGGISARCTPFEFQFQAAMPIANPINKTAAAAPR